MTHPMVKHTTGVSVRLDAVRRAFDGGVIAVDSVSLDIPPGQFVAILGPSGCGKSTILRLIAGLDRPTSGQVDLGGHVSPRDAIAYVFQDAHLLPWRNVLDNVALPLELCGRCSAERKQAAWEAIEQVGLADAATRYPNQLSGGMRMRASLARALVTNPRLLLLDEPFAALDEITRHRLDEQLRELWLSRAMTVVFVTHSTAEAAFLSERAIVLSQRPARIVGDHNIDLPADRSAELRAKPAFAAQMGVLYDSLRSGGE